MSLRRSGPPRRFTPLRAMSRKTASLRPARRRAVAATLERDGGCVLRAWRRATLSSDTAGFIGPCWGPLDGHEIRPRSQGGNPYDADGMVTLCRAHHGEVHAHPALGVELGLLWERSA